MLVALAGLCLPSAEARATTFTITSISGGTLVGPNMVDLANGASVTVGLRVVTDTDDVHALGASAHGYDEALVNFVSGDAVSTIFHGFCQVGVGCFGGVPNSSGGALAESAIGTSGNRVSFLNLVSTTPATSHELDPGLDGAIGGDDDQFRLVFTADAANSGVTMITFGTGYPGDTLLLPGEVEASANSAVLTLNVGSGGGVTPPPPSGSTFHDTVYVYDELNRLEYVRSNGAQISYSYDDAGNRTSIVVPEPLSGLPVAAGAMLLVAFHRTRSRRLRRSARRPKVSGGSSLRDGWFAAFVIAGPLFSAVFVDTAGANDLPALHMPAIPGTPEFALGGQTVAAATAVGSLPAATQPGTPTETSPEIAELARALAGAFPSPATTSTVEKIYEYVYNEIEYDPIWGSHKGALGTLLDGSGGDFDQASLVVALLREVGFFPSDISYVYGIAEYSLDDVSNWLGIDNNAAAISTWLAVSGRDPSISRVVVVGGPIGEERVQIERVLVRVDGGPAGTITFDPAFKVHNEISGLNLSQVTGLVPIFGGLGTFLQDALQGSTQSAVPNPSGPTSLLGLPPVAYTIQDIDYANFGSMLSGYASNLHSYVETVVPGAKLEEVVGGREIDTLARPPMIPNIFDPPITVLSTEFAEWNGEIPNEHRALVGVSLPGLDETFYSDSLGGKRLTIFYESNRPVLRLGGNHVATGTSVSSGSEQSLDVTITHPFPTNFADQSGSIRIEEGGSYLILNGWASTGEARVRHHERLQRANNFEDADLYAEPVLGESLAIFAASWLAQVSSAEKIADGISDGFCFSFHRVGVVGQTANPFIDVPLGSTNCRSRSTGAANYSLFSAVASLSSALEGGVIEQFIPDIPAASTVELLGLANDGGDTFYQTDALTYDVIEPLLTGYSSSDLADIQDAIDAGATVVLPKDGTIQVDQWQGVGYQTSLPQPGGALAVGYIISGGLKGGFGGVPSLFDASSVYDSLAGIHLQSADPVDLVTGDFLFEATDLTVGSQGFPFGLEFERSYNSGMRFTNSGLGLGWTHGFDLSAETASDGFRGLGNASPLDAVGAIVGILVALETQEICGCDSVIDHPSERLRAAILSSLASRWFMDQLTDNVVIVKEPGLTSVFTELPDGTYNPPPGSAAVLEEESDGTFLLTTKHGTKLDYNESGQIQEWEDPNGNQVTFLYSGPHPVNVTDSGGHTLGIWWESGRIWAVSHGARTFNYGYDTAGNLTTVTDANGKVTTFSYSDDGLLESVFTPANPTSPKVVNTYNDLDHVETQVDANGHTWQYFIAPHVRSEEVDPASNSKIAYYDAHDRLIRSVDALGHETTTEYDGQGRIVLREQPEGNLTEFDYDDRHNVTRTVERPKPGSLLAPIVQNFTYEPTFNRVATSQDPLGNTTRYFYDSNGNLDRIEQPSVDGQTPVTSFTYYTRGFVLTRTDPDSMVTRFSYDPVSPDLLKSTVDHGGLNLATTFQYNSEGDVTYQEDPNGNRVLYTVDSMRRVEQTQSAAPFDYLTKLTFDDDGNVTLTERQMGTPAPWQTTSATYSNSGKVLTTTDPEENTTTTTYDVLDRVLSVTDALDQSTTSYYTKRGNLHRTIDAAGVTSSTFTYTPNGKVSGVRDAEGNLTRYRYDGFDRLEFTDFADSSVEQLEYDAASNVETRTLRSGQTVTYTYDSLNRLKTKAPSGLPTITYDYDLVGRLETETTAGVGSRTFGYDTAGRLTSVLDIKGRTVGYQYDDAGNRTRVTYPGGHYVTYAYDELNRLTDVFDAGNPTAIASFVYDRLSRRTEITRSNGVSTTYEWQDDDDLAALEHDFAGGAVRWEYEYNQIGNRILTSVSDAQFQFNPLDLISTTYVTNEMNQHTSAIIDQGSSVPFSHDFNGNRTDALENSYAFDSLNRLTSAALDGGGSATYTYDDTGIRNSRTVNGVTTEFVLDGNQVLEEYDGSGGLLRRYVYAGLDQPIRMNTPAGADYFYHQDAIGSVVALTRESGATSETYSYGPFGTVSQPSSVGNPLLFTGREYDSETGLYYYRARHYDPALGRFLQPDPLGYADGLNVYAYVGGNPINLVDPLGLFGSVGGFAHSLRNGGSISRIEEPELFSTVSGFVGLDGPSGVFSGYSAFSASYEEFATDRNFQTGAGGLEFVSGPGRLVSATRGATRLLPEVTRSGRLTQGGLDHIVLRHFSGTAGRGGKFADGTTARNLRGLIDDTFQGGSIRPNTRNRPGHVFEHDFGRVIGTNSAGKPATQLRVVRDPDGAVRTAFPF